MKKEEVYNFTYRVRELLELLQGIELMGEPQKLNRIQKIYLDIEKDLSKFTPTPYEEYSHVAKVLYNKMIRAKNTYELVKETNNYKEIKKASENYKECVEKYDHAKKIRDAFKKGEM